MKKLVILIFAVCLLCAYSYDDRSGAEVDIELSTFAAQDINLLSRVDTFRRGSDKVTLRFQDNFLLIKSDRLEMAVDFLEEVIYWQEINKAGKVRKYSYKFWEVQSEKESISPRFVSAETLLEKNDFKKSRYAVEWNGEVLEKWKQKLGGENYVEAWTSEIQPEFLRIKALIYRLVNKTGVLISEGGTALWFSTLIDLDSFPVLMHRYEYKQAALAAATVSSDHYFAVTKIGSVDFVRPKDIQGIANQRSLFEKIGLKFNKLSKQLVEFRMLIPTIVIVILISAPFWYPRLSEYLIDRKEGRLGHRREKEETLIRCYNALLRIRKALSPEGLGKTDPAQIREVEKFIKTKVYKKFFSSKEKKQFTELLEGLSETPELRPNQIRKNEHLEELAQHLLEKCNEKIA